MREAATKMPGEVTPETLARHMENLCTRPGKLPADTAAWLREAAAEYMRCEASVSLGGLLGLEGRSGSHTWLTQLRRSRRAEYLRRAGQLLVGDSQVSEHKAAKLLVNAVINFTERKWPLWSQAAEPPGIADEVERCLFHASRLSGGSLPQTWQALQAAGKKPATGNLPIGCSLPVAAPTTIAHLIKTGGQK